MWRTGSIGFATAMVAALPALAQPAVDGEIDAPKALAALFGNYDAAKKGSTWKDPRLEEYYVHGSVLVEAYAVQDAVVDGRPVWFLYTTATPHPDDSNCLNCPILGAAIFEKEGGRWINRAFEPLLSAIGYGGAAGAVKPVRWGVQAFGLLVDGASANGFENRTFQTLFGFEHGAFREIFTLTLTFEKKVSLTETVSFEHEWSFGRPGPRGIYDVIVKTKVRATETYRYDGTKYRDVRTHQELGR